MPEQGHPLLRCSSILPRSAPQFELAVQELDQFRPPHSAITSPSSLRSGNIFLVRIVSSRLYLNHRAGPLPQNFQSSDADFDGGGMIPCSYRQGFQFPDRLIRLPQHQPEFRAFDLDLMGEGEPTVD